MLEDYKDGDIIYILMKGEAAAGMMRDWLQCNYRCDLHVCRSKKNKGCVVVKTTDLMWASRIIQWHGYERVTYAPLTPPCRGTCKG